ncbi:MAG: hypothetical protein NBV68_08445 [Erythrobacter sp.]|uniref:hypothetical protein n=1 Tax=Erythrobacter sp. TaxID=1042 RepID=UPI0025F0E25D|nr:hypothetical protein [Erythrobacter sp.]MCL9999396.1 hypothetical protein [Erythrobacter sp.]
MMRLLFQNSRMALAFVVLIVLGAAAMIGPQGNGGLVTRAVSLSESQRGLLAGGTQGAIGAQSEPRAPPSVFGEYNPDAAAPTAPTASDPNAGNPMTAPLAPTAVVAPPGAASAEQFIPDKEMPQ